MSENWKYIKGYEDVYSVSNFGRVKRHAFSYLLGNAKIYKEDHIIKPVDNTHGYLQVSLSINNISKSIKVHRLVALAFIPNPENKYAVNHKNGVKTDNNIENLEWVTKSENQIHLYRVLKAKSPLEGLKYGKHHYAKMVGQYDFNNNLIKTWSCAREAADKSEFCFKCISGNCRGKTKSHRGFIFKFIHL